MKKFLIEFIVILIITGCFHNQSIVNSWKNFGSKRNLIKVVGSISQDKLLISFPCFQNIKFGENEMETMNLSKQFDEKEKKESIDFLHQSLISCLLGNHDDALGYYLQGADKGDDWQALQAYMLLTKKGENEIAIKVLNQSDVDVNEAYNFLRTLKQYSLEMNIINLANYALKINDNNELSWNMMFYACDYFRLEKIASDHRLTLSCYDRIISSPNSLSKTKLSLVYMYRAETMRYLYPEFSADDVIEYYEFSIKYDPKNIFAYLGLSNVYLWDLLEIEEAKACLDQALLVDPNSADTYLRLGDLFIKQGNFQEAIFAYEKSLFFRPGWAIAIDKLDTIRKELD